MLINFFKYFALIPIFFVNCVLIMYDIQDLFASAAATSLAPGDEPALLAPAVPDD
jgi:hypothetical protein